MKIRATIYFCKVNVMNVVKGFDRIALAIAVISIIPSFLIGYVLSEDVFKRKTEYYKIWESKKTLQYEPAGARWQFEVMKPIGPPPRKYDYPPAWQKALGGISTSIMSFVVVLLLLKLLIRSVNWIAEGFRD
jgi:hypothetical protein